MDTVPNVSRGVWRDWMFDPPYAHVGRTERIELRSGLMIWSASISEIPAWANVAGLEWRRVNKEAAK